MTFQEPRPATWNIVSKQYLLDKINHAVSNNVMNDLDSYDLKYCKGYDQTSGEG